MFIICSASAHGQQSVSSDVREPNTASIMAQVAANQDRAEDERSRYVYVQHAHVVSRRRRTVMCEETTDSRITPSRAASRAELLKLDGRLLKKHGYMTYTTLLAKKNAGSEGAASSTGQQKDESKVEAGTGASVQADHDSLTIDLGDEDTDRDLVEHIRSNLTENDSKDGIDTRLFPLTSKAQPDYAFTLRGRERMNGRDVFHVEFTPRDKHEYGWKGDAYIDSASYQPVVVSTEMARKVPLAIRTLLGTNVPGLGFTIVYAPQPDGVWFPVSLSTEFKLHVLFFFSREIIIDAQNRAFEKTHVNSKIVSNDEVAAPIE